jgi:L,D-transpeptidase ErfK/SrfK
VKLSLHRFPIVVAIAVVMATGVAQSEEHSARRVTGAVQTYEVLPGDSWQSVASRFGVDARTIAAYNGLTTTTPLRLPQDLHIDNRHIVPDAAFHRSIVVNIPQKMLFVSSGDGDITAFPVAVGRPDWRTPRGPFTVVKREQDPSWEVPQSILEEARRAGKSLPTVVPPGPDNPLGRFWLGLSLGAVGIHGTNAPASIYRAVTHGCIRLHPEDIEALFDRVKVGTTGEVIYEPVLITVEGGDVLLEAHPDIYGRTTGDPLADVLRRAVLLGIADRIDPAAAARALKRRAGVARSVVTTP